MSLVPRQSLLKLLQRPHSQMMVAHFPATGVKLALPAAESVCFTFEGFSAKALDKMQISNSWLSILQLPLRQQEVKLLYVPGLES